MSFINTIGCLFLATLMYLPQGNASPSETNYFSMSLEGEDAERFKEEVVSENTYRYGENKSHLSMNYSLSFVKEDEGSDTDRIFVFRIDCQQRVKFYQTKKEEKLAPSCDFVYFNEYIHTTIIMTPEISKKMIKNLKWTQQDDWFYFGCQDYMSAGCPVINFNPARGDKEAHLEVHFYKP